MNLSGIVVTAAPARVPEVAAALAVLPSIEVHRVDPAGGRIVVVQERATIADEMDGLRAIQRLPGVIAADLVVHYFGDADVPPGLPVAEVARRLEPEPAGAEPGSAPDPNPNLPSWRPS